MRMWHHVSRTGGTPVTETDTHPLTKTPENNALQVEVKMLREQMAWKDEIIDELRQDRDDWKGQAKTLLIANQNAQDTVEKPRGFIARVFGG